jgi:hypothetical protein
MRIAKRLPIALRSGLLAAMLLSLHAQNVLAQNNVDSLRGGAAPSAQLECRIEPIGCAVPVPFEMGVLREIGPNGPVADWLHRSGIREPDRLFPSMRSLESMSMSAQQPAPRRRSWFGRHPILFGTLVGFGVGFFAGYLPGDDGVFYDFTAEFNGLVLGGAGAGAGAFIGYAINEAAK